MKYVKFRMVDSQTGISVFRKESVNGQCLPRLGDIYDLFTDFGCDWYYAKCEDTVEFNEENDICEITESEYIDAIGEVIETEREDNIKRAYEEEKTLRTELFGHYHESATIAGVQKYQEALEFLNTGTVSDNLRIESETRSVSVEILANKIVDNHNKFRLTDSKLSGLRGMIVDRNKSFVFDRSDPYESFMTWRETELVPNIRLLGTSDSVDELSPASQLGKHVPDLGRRWEYLLFLEEEVSGGV